MNTRSRWGRGLGVPFARYKNVKLRQPTHPLFLGRFLRRCLEVFLLLVALGSFALSAVWGGAVIPALPERWPSSLEAAASSSLGNLGNLSKGASSGTSSKDTCSEAFRALLDSRKGSLSSRDYLRVNLSQSYARTRHEWYRSEVAVSAIRNLKERLNLYKYFQEGLASGEKILWIQQGLLKDLNEKLWDIGGTEYYLLKLDDVLADVLEAHPSWGRVIHKNYKDRVIVTSLSTEDIQSKLLHEVQKRVAQSIGEIRSNPGANYSWESFIEQSLRFSEGLSLEAAYADLMLRQYRMSFEEWQKATITLRKRLKMNFENRGLSWAQVLRAGRRYKNSDESLMAYFAKQGVPISRQTLEQLRDYMHLMRLGDFLPLPRIPTDSDVAFMKLAIARLEAGEVNILEDIPRLKKLLEDSWGYRRAVFLDDIKTSGSIVATDISGLGEKALLAQDAWIDAGARLSELPAVYRQTSEFLNTRYAEIESELRAVLGKDAEIYVYRSGDDALWGLPPLDAFTMKKVKEILGSNKDLYSQIVTIEKSGNPEAVADAIYKAREELFRLKPEKKPDLDLAQ